jgi:membrane fusion protein, copper/silver efflux system
MKTRILPITLGILIIAILSFALGIYYGERTGSAPSTTKQAVQYTCPMHPQYRSNRPGDCPSCGMRLVPMNASGNGAEASKQEGAASDLLYVNAVSQQAIGVRIGMVEKGAGSHILRTTGRVAADEGRLFRLNASVDFWIREMFPPTTGSLVRKNEPLLSFYSANFLSAAASYMYALDTVDRQKATPGANTPEQSMVVDLRLRQAVDGLKALGVSDYQIEEMARTRKVSDLVTIRSPMEGFILARNASLGQYIQPGTELYQIADLSHIWILVDIFENEEKFLRPGDRVKVRIPNQGTTLFAKVSNILPRFDSATRTLKVRLEAENPGFKLRPDVFVDAELPVNYPTSITVPADAVIDTGLKKRVFVDRGNGFFEPREIETGWRFGDRVQILSGLAEGERIVISGTFLIDSESRMKMPNGVSTTQAENAKPVKDLVCGMDVDPKAVGVQKTQYKGATYYFCSEMCKKRFQADPAKYIHATSKIIMPQDAKSDRR